MLNQSAQLDRMFQALADPSRRAMLERLCKGPASVSDLAEPFQMSLPAVLRHLQLLQQSGLVKTEKVGRVRTCSVETKALRSVEHRGGLDAYLLKAGDEELSLKARRLKRDIAKVQSAQASAS